MDPVQATGRGRTNAITGERVLEMDHRGREAARREMERGTPHDVLIERTREWVTWVWTASGSPPEWDVDIEREAPQEFPPPPRFPRVFRQRR